MGRRTGTGGTLPPLGRHGRKITIGGGSSWPKALITTSRYASTKAYFTIRRACSRGGELDLTDLAREGGELLVVIRPIPKAPAPADRLKVQASRSVKPAVGYGWDFHPRLVPLGIWDDAYIEMRSASHLGDAELRYQLSDDCGEARLTLEACVAAGMSGQRLQWTCATPAGARC